MSKDRAYVGPLKYDTVSCKIMKSNASKHDLIYILGTLMCIFFLI